MGVWGWLRGNPDDKQPSEYQGKHKKSAPRHRKAKSCGVSVTKKNAIHDVHICCMVPNHAGQHLCWGGSAWKCDYRW